MVNGNFATDLLQSLDFSPNVLGEILIIFGGKHNKAFYQKNKHECANKNTEIIKVKAV